MNMRISQTNESPMGLESLMKIPHKQYSCSIERLMNTGSIPQTPADLRRILTRLTVGNNFSNGRYPYLPIIKKVFQQVLGRFWPKKDELSFLEVGPGPVAYSATNQLVPFDKISKYTMIEGSPHYCAAIEETGNLWNLICGDIHEPGEVGTYDVIYCQSSLDSTPFMERVLLSLYEILNPEGRIFVFQDVFPNSGAILGIECQQREEQKCSDEIEFGMIDHEPVIWLNSIAPWIDNPGHRISTSEYWNSAFKFFAGKSCLEILNKETIWNGKAIIPLPTNDDLVRDELNGYNSLERYHAYHSFNLSGIPKDHYAASYATDVFVLAKNVDP